VPGRRITDEECDELWAAWTPSEVAERMAGVTAPWCVVAGWALELFTRRAARVHGDLEISVPRGCFDDVVAAFPGFEWDVTDSGELWPYAERAEDSYQTWLRDPVSGRYRLDVFREHHDGDRWVCRRDPSITMSYDELILRTAEGIPFVIPEVALLFKAKAIRDKDERDFRRVLPVLDGTRRSRLAGWLDRVHPGHPWLAELAAPDASAQSGIEGLQ
jgi:hypothetical protein